MKDESLREALRGAARHEPAPGDPFARFEVVRRRNAVARGLVLFGIGAALMFAFLNVFPNPFRAGPPADYPVGGELDPTLSPVRIFQDPVAGYQLEYRPDWNLRGEAGGPITFYVETNPPLGSSPVTDITQGDPYDTEVPRTFFVQVTPLRANNQPRAVDRERLGALGNAGAIVTTDNIFPGEKGQARTEQLRVYYAPKPVGGSAKRVGWWCVSCRLFEATVVLEPARGVPPLHIRIVAPNDAALQEYLFDAIALMDSIERFIEV